jgi:hypothetical protein
MRFIVAGLVLAALAPAKAADPVVLQWKLAKGDVIYAKTVQKMEQTVGVMGMSMDQNQDSTIVTKYTVLDTTSDGGFVLEQSIVKADITGNIPGVGDTAGNMKGATLTFTLDKNLKVTKVDGYEAYVEKISGGNDDIGKVLKASATPDTLKVAVEDMLAVGPGKPASVGDTWKRDTKLSVGPLGDFTLNATYKLDEVKDGAAKVSYTADATFAAGKGGGGLPFQITKGELKAKDYAGSLVFDPAAGRPKSGTMSTEMGGTLTVSVNGMELDITFKQNQKVTTTFGDKSLADD